MAIENKILTFGASKIGIVDGKIFGFPPPPPIQLGAFRWYKADNIIKDGLDRVSQWNDDSGNGGNLTQGTGNSQPLWEASYTNGNPTINFNGESVNKFLQNTFPLDLTGEFDYFLVADMRTGGGNYPTFLGGVNANKSVSHGWFSNNLRAGSNNGVNTTFNVKAQTLPFNVRLMQINANTTTSKYFENGVQVGSDFDLGTSHILSGFTVGCSLDLASGGRIAGRISEIVVFNKTLTTDERNLMNDYLILKYDL